MAEFFDRATADDRHHDVFARAMSLAQDTALREKRRALGRSLAAGVMGDDARIDEELLFMRAVQDIDGMRIRLLERMATVSIQPPGWSVRVIAEADPGLAGSARALIGTLELHGLIARAVPTAPIRGVGAGQANYYITEQGREFLKRLPENPD